MRTAVLVVCLFGMAYAFPSRSDSNSSPQDSVESHSVSKSDSSSSSSEEVSLPPPGNDTTQTMVTDEQLARGDSLRRKRAIQSVSSSESHSKSLSDSHPDTSSSSSSSEEVSVAPSPDGTTEKPRGDSLRRKRAAGRDPHTSSIESSESVTTESTSSQSHKSESSEEDSHERSTKQNLLQGIVETSTVPDTSEESSEEKTTPAFQP